jgi:hypothetical protein
MTGLAAVAAAMALAGSGMYTSTGTTYYFTLFNGGATTWQSFRLVGPPGTTFVVTLAAPVRCGSPFAF